MPTDIDAQVEVLKNAIMMELEGQDFFKRAAERMSNERARDTFLGLVKQEQRHVEILETEFAMISEGKNWASVKEVIAGESSIPRVSVFKDAHIKRLKLDPAAGELDVLKLGMEVEKKSIEYYKQAGTMVRDAKARDLFRWLVGEEAGHLTILNAEFDNRSKSGYYYDTAEFTLENE